MRPETFGSRPLHTALLLGALLGLAGGIVSSLSAGPTAANADVPWQLPDAASLQRYRQEDYDLLVQSPAWRGQATAAAVGGVEQPAVVRWRLVGIVSDNGGTALVLADGNPQVQRIASGGSLPDGSTLLSIATDRIVIDKGGCQQTRRLFVPATGGEPACDNPAPPAATPPGTP